MKDKGLTLVEILVTIGILSLIILTLVTSSIFILRSSQKISESQIIKSKLTYYYYTIVFAPFFITEAIYNPDQEFPYSSTTRKELEQGRINVVEDPNLGAIKIFEQLRKKIVEDIDLKNRGIDIQSVEIKLSNKPISSVIIEEPNPDPDSGPKYRIIATLVWFDVKIIYRTKDNRILSINLELPVINNTDSSNILPLEDEESKQ